MLALLSDYTVQNVVLGAVFLGLLSGALGSFAVLRQQSLLGDTLAHAALPGICLGFIAAGTRHLPSILLGALLTGIAAALVMVLLTRRSRLKTDAALGIALSVSFALGVVLLTYLQGQPNAAQGGLDSFLFGQAAAILRSDLWIMGGVTALSLGLVALMWKEFKLATFDPIFAASIGLPVVVLELLLTALIALAVVIGLQMVGVVLMAAMVIAPAVAARQWSAKLESMVVLAGLFGIASGIIGSLISALGQNLATGPLIVLSASAIVLVSLALAPGRGLLWAQLKLMRERKALRGQQVLTTMYNLASHHRDPAYPSEQGMIDSFYGLSTRGTLRRLARRGLITEVGHMHDEGTHWELTERGRDEAERVLEHMTAERDA
ncbi:MAG: metal ABC transporter permease [Geminicoccaceae bacterium]